MESHFLRQLKSCCARAAALLALLTTLAGCSSDPSRRAVRSGAPSGPIQEIHLFGHPVALNTDRIPGPDALGVRIFVSNRAAPRGLPIKSGHVEVLMFDAVPARSEGSNAPQEPLRTWTFSPDDLRPNEGKTAIGIGYRLALPLGDVDLQSAGATLIARYVDPSGRAVASSPSTISLRIK